MAQLTISHAKSNTIADWSGTVTVADSTGGTATAQASNLIRPSDWNSNHVATLALSASDVLSFFTVSGELSMSTNTSGATIYEAQVLGDYFEPFPLHNTNSTLFAPGNGTWYFDPIMPYDGLQSGQIRMFVANGASSQMFQNGAVITSNSTGAATKVMTIYNRFGIYSQGTGANSTRLESYWTGAADFLAAMSMTVGTTTGTTTSNGTVSVGQTFGLTIPKAWDISGGQTTSSFSATGSTQLTNWTTSTSAASAAGTTFIGTAASQMNGSIMVPVGFNTTLPPGNYWFANLQQTTSSTAGTNYGAGTLFSTQSKMYLLENNLGAFKQLGATVSNSTSAPVQFHGAGTSTTTNAAAMATLGTSNMVASTGRLYWNYMQTSL